MTGRILFCNNASTTLAGAISNTATSLQVATGAGALFATPINGTYTGGNYLCLTLNDAATGQLFEVMHVTAVVGDTLTVVRAQEGTTALSWLAGDKAANFWTSGSASAMAQAVDVQDQAGNYAADSSGAANTITVTLNPVPVSYTALLGAPIRVKLANTNTSTSVVLNVNTLGNLTVKLPNGGAPAIGSLVAGSIVTFAYDGTNAQVTSGYTAPASSTTSVVSTAQSIGASNSNTNYVATGAFTATIAQSTTLGQNWTVTLDAQAGAVTVAINAADVLMVNGATFAAGTGTTFPQGSSVTLTTDAAGHIYAVPVPILDANSDLSVNGKLQFGNSVTSGSGALIGVDTGGVLAVGSLSGDTVIRSAVGSGTTARLVIAQGNGGVIQAVVDALGNLFTVGAITIGATFNADGTISGGNAVATLDQLTGAAGTVCNAKMSLTAASSSAAFSAEQIVVATSLGGAPLLLPNYSQTINLATTGAGGMDTGSAPTSGFVSLYAIYGTAGTSILACNATTSSGTIYSGAHMPSGYAYSALIGVWPTNSSGQFVIGSLQDRRVNIVLTVAFTGAATATNTYQTLSLSSIVPPNAVTVSGVFGSPVSGSYSPAIAIASNTSGVGEQLFVVNANGFSSDGFYTGAPFDNLIMTTAQQMAWKCTVDTTARNQIAINGYCF